MVKPKVAKLSEVAAHAENVNCVRLGRKTGKVLATGGEDKKVNLWTLGRPTPLMTLTGHTSAVETVAFDAAEEVVVAGSCGGTLKLWDLEQEKVARTLTGHRSSCLCVDFHPFGEYFASGSLDTNVKVWDVRRKGCINTYKGHTKGIRCVRFSPDGGWVVSGGEDGVVKMWDIRQGKPLTEFVLHTGPITCLDFHPTEYLLASGSSDRTVKFWDLDDFRLVSSSEPMETEVRCITFTPDGETLLAASSHALNVLCPEPHEVYDRVDVGWPNVSDMSISQNELVCCGINQNFISPYLIHLPQLRPYSDWVSQRQGKTDGDARKSRDPYSPHDALPPTPSHTPHDSHPPPPSHPYDLRPHSRPQSSSRDPSPRQRCDDPYDRPLSGDPSAAAGGAAGAVTSGSARGSRDPEVPDPLTRTAAFASRHRVPRSPKSSGVGSGDDPRGDDNEDDAARMVAAAVSRSSTRAHRHHWEAGDRLAKLTLKTEDSSGLAEDGVTPRTPAGIASKSPVVGGEFSDSGKHVSVGIATGDSLVLPRNTPPVSAPSPRDLPVGVSIQTGDSIVIRGGDADSGPDRRTPPPSVRAAASGPPTGSIRVGVGGGADASGAAIRGGGGTAEKALSDAPLGVDPSVFVRGNAGATGAEPSHDIIINKVSQAHHTMMGILQTRLTNVRVITKFWAEGNPKRAIEAMNGMRDPAVLVDVLGAVDLGLPVFNMDLSVILLPQLSILLTGRFDSYVHMGLDTMQKVYDAHMSGMVEMLKAPPSVGVDFSREQRLETTKRLSREFLNLRPTLSEVLKREGDYVVKARTILNKLDTFAEFCRDRL
eukprot:Rmarinus@m.24327